MVIVAGWLQVAANERDAYPAAVDAATRQARAAKGCLEFVQAPDPITPGRIVIFERWESEADLLAFRNSGSPGDETKPTPTVHDADVKRYQISEIGPA